MSRQRSENSFYMQQLKKALKGPYAEDYRITLNHNDKPMGTVLSIGRPKKTEGRQKLAYYSNKKPVEPLKKICLECKQEFKWDYKCAKSVFERKRYCDPCKKLSRLTTLINDKA